jgi:hypothetical protein
MRKRVLAVIASVLCLAMVAGCGKKKKTLEKEITEDELKMLNTQYYLSTVKEGSDFKSVKFEIEDNHLIYKYWFSYTVSDEDALGMQMNGLAMKSEIEKVKDGFENDFGIRPELISYIYYNPDGKELFRVEN